MSVNETSTFKIDGWMIRSVATTATKFVTAMSHNGKSNVRVYNVGRKPKEGIIHLTDKDGNKDFKNINSVAIFYTGGSLNRTYVAAGGDSGTTYVWVLSEGTKPVQTMNNQLRGKGFPIRSLMMDNMYLLRLSDSKSEKSVKTASVYTLNVAKYEEIGSQMNTAVLGGGLKHISMHGSNILTVNDKGTSVQLWSVGRTRNSIKKNFNKLKDIENIHLIALGKKSFVTVTNDINLYDYEGNLKKTITNDSKPTDVSMHMEKIVACFKDKAKVWNDDGEELAELKVEGAKKVAVRGNTIIVIGTKKAHIFACVIASEPCPSRASEGLRPEEIPLYILKAITPQVKLHPQYGKLRY